MYRDETIFTRSDNLSDVIIRVKYNQVVLLHFEMVAKLNNGFDSSYSFAIKKPEDALPVALVAGTNPDTPLHQSIFMSHVYDGRGKPRPSSGDFVSFGVYAMNCNFEPNLFKFRAIAL